MAIATAVKEAVAEAARDLLEDLVCRATDRGPVPEHSWPEFAALDKALAALEEEK